MAANLPSYQAMFQRLGMSQAAALRLVDTKGINLLELLANLTVLWCKSLVYAIRHPGGVGQGRAVAEKAEHNLAICCAVYRY